MKKIRIMIAEDFDLLREDIADTISKTEDMEVIGLARSGEEIQKLVANADVDIVLMDVEMETSHAGIRACEMICEEYPNTKVIFLSAHDSEDMILTSLASGAVDYIVKGAPEEELLDHIRKVHEDKPSMDARLQSMLMKEYQRLRKSEISLIFFINTISKLTRAERELIRLLIDGYKLREIAEMRYVELGTVKSQIKTLLKKFNCKRTREIVKAINDFNVAHLF